MYTVWPHQAANGTQQPIVSANEGLALPTRAKLRRRPLHGVLVLDKPLGISSHAALQKAKWLLRAEKAGHTGTLDPLATGVLPLCFGAACKFSQLHLDANKTYDTTVRLGVRTDTADAEGEVIERRAVRCTAEQVAQVLQQFMGPLAQIPPMHSALKKNGKALYEYARAGQTVVREPRQVVIHHLALIEMQLTGEAPFLRLRVACSKGTYIRTLGEDIALALGCGGHLSALRRVTTGPFQEADCITLDKLTAMDEAQREACLLPVSSLLSDHSAITLGSEDAGRFLSGLRRRGTWADQERVSVFGAQPTALLGSAHVKAGELIPGRLLSPIEIQQILQSSSVKPATYAAQTSLKRET